MEPMNMGVGNPNINPEPYNAPSAPEQLNVSPEQREALIPNTERSFEQRQMPATSVQQPDPISQENTTPPVQPQNGQLDQGQMSISKNASDTDQMEQEWVNEVKKIISRTSNDPSAQQDEISRLMAEYVLKRFGRHIGEAD